MESRSGHYGVNTVLTLGIKYRLLLFHTLQKASAMHQFSYRVKDLSLPRLRLVNIRTMARDFQVLIHECGIGRLLKIGHMVD